MREDNSSLAVRLFHGGSLKSVSCLRKSQHICSRARIEFCFRYWLCQRSLCITERILGCGPPPTVQNTASLPVNDSLVGDVLYYECMGGCNMIGASFTICQLSGNWTQQPKCDCGSSAITDFNLTGFSVEEISTFGNANEQRKAGLERTETQIMSEILIQQRELVSQSMMQKTLLVAISALMAALILGQVLAFAYLLFRARHLLECRYISSQTTPSLDFGLECT